MWLKKMKSKIYISNIFILSLFAKHLIAAAEYHEQKSAGYIKARLDKELFVWKIELKYTIL